MSQPSGARFPRLASDPAAFLSKREVVLFGSSRARVLRPNHPLPCPIALWASDGLCHYSLKQFRCWGAHSYHILPTEPWLGLLSICWVMGFSFSAKGQIRGMSSTMSTMPTSSCPFLRHVKSWILPSSLLKVRSKGCPVLLPPCPSLSIGKDLAFFLHFS